MRLKPRVVRGVSVQALAGNAYKSECDCLSEWAEEGETELHNWISWRIFILYFPLSGSTY